MNARSILILGAATLVIAAATAFAQPQQGMHMGMGMPRYDKTTETTLQGIVQEVQSQRGRMGGTGTHLLLATDSGVVDVHLGPSNWLSEKKYEFAAGDHLQVLGSKVKINGSDALIAREIKKGDATTVLRNEDGIPQWAGGRGMPRR